MGALSLLLLATIATSALSVVRAVGEGGAYDAGGLFPGITSIDTPDSVPVPPFHGPACFPTFTTPFATPVKVLIVVGDGSDINGYIGTYKYFNDRGATVDTLCLPSQTTVAATVPGAGAGALLMNVHYPFATITCTTTDVAVLDTMGSSYNVIYVPGGYLATLQMRREGTVPNAIKGLLNPTDATPTNSSVVLDGGAVELLIGTGVLSTLNITASTPFPSATPATTAAVLVEVCKNNMDGSVDCGQNSPNSTGVFSNVTSRRLFVADRSRDLSSLLPWVAQLTFQYMGDDLYPIINTTNATNNTTDNTTNNTSDNTTNNDTFDYAPIVNCSLINTTVALTTNLTNLTASVLAASATIVPATTTTWGALASGRETVVDTVSNITKLIPGECRNSNGISFCEGFRISIVVANGIHDTEVITAAGVFQQLGANVKLICPDADESMQVNGGKVFLSSNPAFVPTYQVQCSEFYNRTDMITATLVVISSGPIATHGRLRMDPNLVRVIQYTGTFSAYGSALTLLDTILVGKDEFRPTDVDHSDIEDAPLCPSTNADMSLLNFNMTAGAISKGSRGLYGTDTSIVLKMDAPNMIFRTPALRRTKVLGGYIADDQIMANYTQFLAFTAQSLVWENGPSGSNDALIVGILLGACGLVIVIVVVVMFVRSRTADAAAAGFTRLPAEDPSGADILSLGSGVFDRGQINKENTFYENS